MMATCKRRAARIGLMLWLAILALGGMPLGMLTPTASAAMQLDIDEELRLLRDGKARLHIGQARYRFAVFTFDDPDGTGLGNAVASILSHELLMNGKVRSVGVLRYLGELGKASDDRQLRYFDKVEPLIESQGVQVAIWGVIRRSGDRVRIDSFTQLSPSVLRAAFSFSFRLPQEMGGGRLVHRVGPGRMLTQRLELSAEQAGTLGRQAENLDRLRATPKDSAPYLGRLPLGSVYYLQQRQGAWARVVGQSDLAGWLRAAGYCTGPCAPLLAVPRFASGLMAYDDRGEIPDLDDALAPDAKAFIDQLFTVEVLNRAPAEHAEQEALHRLKPWCRSGDEARGYQAMPPPGGAAICNLRALARLIGPSRRAARDPAADRKLSQDLVHSVADELARGSMTDPRHLPTLRNLATLFSVLGDDERLKLANRLAVDAEAADPVPSGDATRPPESPALPQSSPSDPREQDVMPAYRR